MLHRTSRHGLVRCATCRRHIRAGERPSATDCPFCGANLAAGGGAVAAGRGAVIAAGLLALSLAGCGGKTEPPVEPCETSCAPEEEPDAGDIFDAGMAEDPPSVARYGIAPGP